MKRPVTDRRGLVVGYGSIGQRHARLLDGLGLEVAVVTRRPAEGVTHYDDLAGALAAHDPDYVVVAGATAEHAADIAALADAGYRGHVLVEKPLFAASQALPKHGFAAAGVAYNLRFHPLLRAMKAALAGETVLQVQAYAGQHLADWRPGRDYRDSYSARAAGGGGVLRDPSHELDLLVWLFGPWRRLAALGGRLGDLEIDSDDAWTILLQLDACPQVGLQLNYHDRPDHRALRVTTAQHSFHADLRNGRLTRDGVEQQIDAPRDASYIAQHRALLGDGGDVCSLQQGLAVVAMIEAIETAARQGGWVEA